MIQSCYHLEMIRRNPRQKFPHDFCRGVQKFPHQFTTRDKSSSYNCYPGQMFPRSFIPPWSTQCFPCWYKYHLYLTIWPLMKFVYFEKMSIKNALKTNPFVGIKLSFICYQVWTHWSLDCILIGIEKLINWTP